MISLSSCYSSSMSPSGILIMRLFSSGELLSRLAWKNSLSSPPDLLGELGEPRFEFESSPRAALDSPSNFIDPAYLRSFYCIVIFDGSFEGLYGFP